MSFFSKLLGCKSESSTSRMVDDQALVPFSSDQNHCYTLITNNPFSYPQSIERYQCPPSHDYEHERTEVFKEYGNQGDLISMIEEKESNSKKGKKKKNKKSKMVKKFSKSTKRDWFTGVSTSTNHEKSNLETSSWERVENEDGSFTTTHSVGRGENFTNTEVTHQARVPQWPFDY